MVLSGEKLEEYREIKPHWNSRLVGKEYDAVEFVNGYRKDSRRVLVECNGICIGVGNSEWGAPGYNTYIIKLGKQLALTLGD